jgi:hypothetical protein
MSEQPPAYEEAAGDNHGTLEESPPLVIRLQAWHFTPRGRCPDYNHSLANLFHQSNLEHWIVRPTDVPEPNDESSRNHFVPVEVSDFNEMRPCCEVCPRIPLTWQPVVYTHDLQHHHTVYVKLT